MELDSDNSFSDIKKLIDLNIQIHQVIKVHFLVSIAVLVIPL